MQLVLHFDLVILRLFSRIQIHRVFQVPLTLFVRLADGYIWIFIAAYLWFDRPPEVFRNILLHSGLAIAVSLSIYWPLKLLVKRRRPFDSDLNLGIKARVPPLDKYSFPSGHTMNNLCVGMTLAFYMPDLHYFALGLPLFLGTLRIYFGVHYLSDITAGGILGFLSFAVAKSLYLYYPG